MRTAVRAFLLAGLAALGPPPGAAGVTTGGIRGVVLDEDGEALSGAAVSLLGPARAGAAPAAEHALTTSGDGAFRFLGLPPGVYSLRARREGFGEVEATGIEVGIDRLAWIELQLDSTMAGGVSVVSGLPLIDPGSAATGARYGAALFGALPLPRDASAVVLAAPAVAGAEPAPAVTLAETRQAAAIGGAATDGSRHLVDGLEVSDPATGEAGAGLPPEMVEAIEVKIAGWGAAHGGAVGGLVNAVTRAGGGSVHGELFAFAAPDALRARAVRTPRLGRPRSVSEREVGATLGGSAAAGRLSYFVAASRRSRRLDFDNRGALAQARRDERLSYAGKLSWQAAGGPRWTLAALGDPAEVDGRPVIDAYGLLAQDDRLGGRGAGLTVHAAAGRRLFFEVFAGGFSRRDETRPLADRPRYEVRQRGGNAEAVALAQGCAPAGPFVGAAAAPFGFAADCAGGVVVREDARRSRRELRFAADLLAGGSGPAHELALGAAYRELDSRERLRYPGRLSAAAGGGVDSGGRVYDPGGLAGQRWLLFDDAAVLMEVEGRSTAAGEEVALWAEDRVRLGSRATLTLGLRAEALELRGAGSGGPSGRRLDFGLASMLAPRIGLAVDLGGDGRSRLYAHFGRFFATVPLDVAARAFGPELFRFHRFAYPAGGALPTGADPGEWLGSEAAGVVTAVQPGLDPAVSEEWGIGFEAEPAPRLQLGAFLLHRELRDAVEDLAMDGGRTVLLANPGAVFTVDPATGEGLPEPAVFPDPARRYDALALFVRRRLSGGWQLDASFVETRGETRYGGLFRAATGRYDAEPEPAYDLPALLAGARGPLPGERRRRLEILGSRTWRGGLVTGMHLRLLSGAARSRLGAHPLLGRNARFVTPRGAAGRGEELRSLDLRFEAPVPIGKRRLLLRADLFNVTGESAATLVDQEWTARPAAATLDPAECGGADPTCPDGNPFWGEPLAVQDPRRIRLGVHLRW